jgi:hypothetical protein
MLDSISFSTPTKKHLCALLTLTQFALSLSNAWAEDPIFPPVFQEIKGTVGGGGLTVELQPSTGKVAVLPSALLMAGTAGRVHVARLENKSFYFGDGAYSVVLGPSNTVGRWQSAVAVQAGGLFGYGLTRILAGPLRFFGMGTGAIDLKTAFRTVENAHAQSAADVEGGLVAAASDVAMIAVSASTGVEGAFVANENDYFQVDGGLKLKAAIKDAVYLRFDLQKSLVEPVQGGPAKAAKVFLDVQVCRVCMLGINFDVKKFDDQSTRYIIVIQGGLAI